MYHREAQFAWFALFLPAFAKSDLALQIAWAVPPVHADDEISAYEEVKAIIRSCLSVQFRVRTTAADVQKQLGAIMRHRGWTNSLLDAVSGNAASEMTP